MQIIQFSTFSGFPHISIDYYYSLKILNTEENRFNAPSNATVLMLCLSRVGHRTRLAKIREPSHVSSIYKKGSVIQKVKNWEQARVYFYYFEPRGV